LKDLTAFGMIESNSQEFVVEYTPQPIYRSLLCISTAFELLSGQG
jgi:hypothetical protein